MRVLHLLFAPIRPRPLLLALVRLHNPGRELLQLDYTELWDLPIREPLARPGACLCRLPSGERALADLGSAIRGRTPEPPPSRGLALAMRLLLPPGEMRELSFAYAAPEAPEPAAALVRAWRGGVRDELEETVGSWREALGQADPVAAYRREVHGWEES